MLILGSFGIGLLAVLFGIVSIFMILVILVQKPKGGGLSGAFGGAGGGSDAVFGTKIGDALTWFTVACFVAFMVLGVTLTIMVQNEQKALTAAPAQMIDIPAGDTAPAGGEPEGDAAPEAQTPADAAKTETPVAEPAATEAAPAEAEKTE